MLHSQTISPGLTRFPLGRHLSALVAGVVGLASSVLYWLGFKMADMRSASSGPPPGSLASIGSHPQAVWSLHQGGVQGVANAHLLQGMVVIAISLGLGKAARASFRHVLAARRQRALRADVVMRDMHVLSEEGRHDF